MPRFVDFKLFIIQVDGLCKLFRLTRVRHKSRPVSAAALLKKGRLYIPHLHFFYKCPKITFLKNLRFRIKRDNKKSIRHTLKFLKSTAFGGIQTKGKKDKKQKFTASWRGESRRGGYGSQG